MNKRYRSVKVPLGVLQIDRKCGTWALVCGAVTLDYGTVQARPEYVHYLPGRLSGGILRNGFDASGVRDGD